MKLQKGGVSVSRPGAPRGGEGAAYGERQASIEQYRVAWVETE